MTTTRGPATAAGRALLERTWTAAGVLTDNGRPLRDWVPTREEVLAIEAEAARSGYQQRKDFYPEQEATLLSAPPLPLDYEAMRMERGWPTPMHMHRIADALDAFTPAKYGDVLRWVADACDAALVAPAEEVTA